MKILQDVLQDVARECIILAEILQDLSVALYSYKFFFKILMFLTRFLQE